MFGFDLNVWVMKCVALIVALSTLSLGLDGYVGGVVSLLGIGFLFEWVLLGCSCVSRVCVSLCIWSKCYLVIMLFVRMCFYMVLLS